MPTEGPLLSLWIGKLLRGIQHHFHNTFNIAISGNRACDIDAQPTRNRRAQHGHAALELRGQRPYTLLKFNAQLE